MNKNIMVIGHRKEIWKVLLYIQVKRYKTKMFGAFKQIIKSY